MADIKTKEARSYNMSRIRGKDTKPEEIVRKFLFSKGFRYRKNDRRLPGSPDIVLPRYKTVVFINGCFWHGHAGCKYFVWPKNNAEFWHDKIQTNISRDKQKQNQLNAIGWNVLVVWECQLRTNMRDETLTKLEMTLRQQLSKIER